MSVYLPRILHQTIQPLWSFEQTADPTKWWVIVLKEGSKGADWGTLKECGIEFTDAYNLHMNETYNISTIYVNI